VIAVAAMAQTLSLHPRNPHYFSYKDRPAVLITSAEHYGSVLNLKFDYGRYLDELKRHGFNLTSTSYLHGPRVMRAVVSRGRNSILTAGTPHTSRGSKILSAKRKGAA
jgi:hypothetical protein